MIFPLTRLAEPSALRLVATARLRDPVLYLLLQNPALCELPRDRLATVAEELAEIEGATNRRQTAEAASATLFPRGRPHAAFVNAAFAYWRPQEANRFNPAGRGAWYAAFEVETALAEVKFHITRALRDAGSYNATIDWSEMWASMAGEFVDLRTVQPRPTCLDPDPFVGYPAGCAVAEEARSAGLNGIVYPSVRHLDGTCIVALWPHVVQSVRQGSVWRMTWSGGPTPVVAEVSSP